jgi:hypothetical protein
VRVIRVLEAVRRLREERGASLTELMTAVTVSIIVLLAMHQILDGSVTASGRVAPRVSAVQEGRLAMEDITRQLRSQVCPGPSQPAVLEGDDDAITFYADYSADGQIDKRTLVFEPDERRIVESLYKGQGTAPDSTFPEAPTRTRVLATRVVRVGETPIFRYYAYGTATPPVPTVLLSTPLSVADRGKAVRIALRFATRPESADDESDVNDIDFASEVFARTADATNASGGTRCM